jgi:hypothetical protein
MAEAEPTKAITWRCRHLYPFEIVTGPRGERRARCFGCGVLGPPRTDLAMARRALRESFAGQESVYLVTAWVPGEKGGYSVAEENQPVTGLRREKTSERRPNAADDVAILDYVMLDFIDEPIAPRENDRHGTVAEPGRRAQDGIPAKILCD